MARERDRLTALKVGRLKLSGLYADGGGLYLQIKGDGRSWVFRYRFGGRTTPRDMGLGSAADVTLADARRKASEARKLLDAGLDPIEARQAAKAAAAADAARALTFKQCADAFIASHKSGWANAKHATQWEATLETYAYPIIGKMSVAGIGVDHVIKILEQRCDDLAEKPTLWVGKTETATRLRGRIENILDWASARKFRSGENPARWRGCLDKLLPKKSKVRPVKHHPALPYSEIGNFMLALRTRDGTAARALEFTVLTAARTGETVGARWGEIDITSAVWVVPAKRMKGRREHRVPLSRRAIEILKAMQPGKEGAIVFPGGKAGKPLSENAMLAVLARMERNDLTAHGFRATFRTWASEQTSYPREVCEAALAHALSDKVEAAYHRSDLFEKRAGLMTDWAKFCATVNNVRPRRSRATSKKPA